MLFGWSAFFFFRILLGLAVAGVRGAAALLRVGGLQALAGAAAEHLGAAAGPGVHSLESSRQRGHENSSRLAVVHGSTWASGHRAPPIFG